MKKLHYSLIILLIIGLLSACTETVKENEDEEAIIVPVETVEATKEDFVIDKVLYGRTAPKSLTPIMLQSAGEIDDLEVENGDKVDEDDLIARIATPVGKQNIYAPKAGEIVKLEAEEGALVSETDPLAMVADLDQVKINFTTTSDGRGLFDKDKKITVMINDEELEAEVTSIATMPDDTGLYPVEAIIENEEQQLLPGLIAVITIPEKRVEDTIILPTEAIMEESDETFIYIVKDNQAVKTEITIKESQSDKTAIEGELEAGDEVVINGQLTLSDGIKVDVVNEEEGNKS